MVPFLVIFLDLGTSKKQLSWRKSFLSMLVGACRVCSTKGCHGHLCNGCKMHGPGCCLCGSCAVVRSDSRCFISAQWRQMSCAQGRGTVLSTCTACPAHRHCSLQARSLDSLPAFKELPLDILIQMCLYDLNYWS